jgi:hypothetical protein
VFLVTITDIFNVSDNFLEGRIPAELGNAGRLSKSMLTRISEHFFGR